MYLVRLAGQHALRPVALIGPCVRRAAAGEVVRLIVRLAVIALAINLYLRDTHAIRIAIYICPYAYIPAVY